MPASLSLHRANRRGLQGTTGVAILKAPMQCGMATIVYRTGHALGAFRMRCHSWGCTYCAPRLARRWTRTLEQAEFRPHTFATLTIDPKELERLCGCMACKDPHEERRPDCLLLDYARQHDLLMGRWRLLLQELRRIAKRRKEQLSYFRATENHRGNYDPVRKIHNHREHWHMLLSLDMGGGFRSKQDAPPGSQVYDAARDEFAQLASRFGFGMTRAYTVDPSNRLVHSYLAKYASKGSSGNYLRVRHISVSRDIRHEHHDADPVVEHHIVAGHARPSIEDLAATARQQAGRMAGAVAVLRRVRARFGNAALDGHSIEQPALDWIERTPRNHAIRMARGARLRRTGAHERRAARRRESSGEARREGGRPRVEHRPVEHVRIELRSSEVVIERTETSQETSQ